jgi:hypothetical protein
MPDKPLSHLDTNMPPAPPSSTASNAPFTPRSSTFPDGLDSDDEDFFVPTPTQSPDAGPHYDDLPPTYDEAQQEALKDARNGVAPVNPEIIDVRRLQLDETGVYQIPPGADVRAHQATAAEERRDRTVPVQHVGGSESVVVGTVGDTPLLDQRAVLLSAALEFTRHEPDGDARFAPRLTRCVAIPQISLADGKGKGKQRECGGRREGRGRGRGRGGRSERHVPGQWPDTSSETLSAAVNEEEEQTPFLRSYAKALHAHSIRPAEFLDFLDGLNALCAATGTTSADITESEADEESPAALVRNYLNTSNEVFFAPRGLRVSVRSLSALVDAARIPEERGQRAGAVASVLDETMTSAGRAQALHPWIEPLETNVPEPSTSVLVLREMASRLRQPSSTLHSANESQRPRTAIQSEDPPHSIPGAEEDPPHSIPGAFPTGPQNGAQGPGWPPFGGWQGRCGRARGGPGGQSWSPFGAPGNGPFGPRGPGRGPFGGPGNGPFGAPVNGPWGRGPGRGAHQRGPGTNPSNSWEAWGQQIGKLGEEFGKRMEVWGEQFGRDAQVWGEDVGRRASGIGSGGVGAVGRGGHWPSQYTPQQQQEGASNVESEGARGQEVGVVNENQNENGSHAAAGATALSEDKSEKKAGRDDDYDDDDASSISSDSDSDSDSDSEDEKDDVNPSKLFNERIRTINSSAESSRLKGKKSPSTIALERSAAIEKATRDQAALESKMAIKQTKRALLRDFREKKRLLRREYRVERRQLKRDGKGKKTKEWKEMRKGFRERKKSLRREKMDAKRQVRDAKWEGKRAHRGLGEGTGRDMVWVVVENLD